MHGQEICISFFLSVWFEQQKLSSFCCVQAVKVNLERGEKYLTRWCETGSINLFGFAIF